MGCIKMVRIECALRSLSVLFAVIAVITVWLDSQTKMVFFISKKASFKDLDALWVLVIVISVAAGYQLLQVMRLIACAWLGNGNYNPSSHDQCGKFVAALNLFLDQGVTYAAFGTTMAALQGSLVAVFGVRALQWSKLCNVYTRFCEQAALGVLFCLLSSLAMAAVSAVSAHRLFRLYPAQRPRSAPKPDGRP